MAATENAHAGDAGALKAWRRFGANHTTTRNFSQRVPRATTARAMLRKLGAAARASRLTRWEAEFVVSLQRQAARPHWRASPRQAAVIRHLCATLAEAEVALIDPDDTVDVRRRAWLPGPEFVCLMARE